MNRITAANTEEVIKEQITKKNLTNKSINTRVFYFAQVISNIDSANLNRIKCRIPIIDDIYYEEGKKDAGDEALPWCIPFSNRILETPDVNEIVMVAVFDSKVPHFGRMFFDSFSNFSTSDYFEKLTPEDKLLSNWDLVEDIFKININGKPKQQGEFNAKSNINYKIGIRGKGQNRIVLDKDNIEIAQNYKLDTQSAITLSQDITIDAYDKIDILSTNGYKTHYNPVFDDPLFDYLHDINQMLKKIVTLLNTSPATSHGGPCLPGKSAPSLISELKTLVTKFEKFKKIGSSEKITIN